MAITKKRRIFINEYLKCWNATEAAKRAGYSPRSAHSTGSRLLKVDEVQQEINAKLEQAKVGAEEVMLIFSRIARGEQIGNDNPSISEILRATENLAKIHNMQNEKLDGDIVFRVVYGDVSNPPAEES